MSAIGKIPAFFKLLAVGVIYLVVMICFVSMQAGSGGESFHHDELWGAAELAAKERFGDDINFPVPEQTAITSPATDGTQVIDGEFTTKYAHVVHFHMRILLSETGQTAKWRILEQNFY